MSSLDVPDWLKGHPELRARNIELSSGMKPWGNLFHSVHQHGSPYPQYVVKVLDPATEEGAINERLQADLSPPNHALPSEIVPSEPQLLVMPFVRNLGWMNYKNVSISFYLDIFYQIVEGVEYLHELRMAHLDICYDNVAYCPPSHSSTDMRLVEGRVYLIDFHTSRQLALGPGRQPAIVLPESQEDKPLGITSLDPYSFDVYCTGKLLHFILIETPFKEVGIPWLPRRYAQWLVGNERGCTSVCRCRPTARRARQVLTVLRWLVYVSEFLGKGFALLRRVLSTASLQK